eukprot:g690.t1
MRSQSQMPSKAGGASAIKLLTLNIFSMNKGPDWERLRRQAALLREEDPDVICLQEVHQNEVADFFRAEFRHYHAFNFGRVPGVWARAPVRLAPLVSSGSTLLMALAARALPAALAGGASAGLLAFFAATLCLSYFVVGVHALLGMAALFVAIGPAAASAAIALVLAAVAVCICPPICARLLHWSGFAPIVLKLVQDDPCGQMVLVRRDAGGDDPSPPSARLFRRAGWAGFLLCGDPYLFWTALFEGSFLRRGMLAVDCTVKGHAVRVLNAHLALGVRNAERLHQVAELYEFALAGDNADRTRPVFVLCDSNSDAAQPDMAWLRRAGFVDSFLECWGAGGRGKGAGAEVALRGDTPHGGWTWDNANALTKGNLIEPDQRLDYVYVLPAQPGGGGSAARVVEARIVGDAPPVSDHYPVVATVELT